MSLSQSNRHSYLLKGLSCMKEFNPRIITRAMDREMAAHTTYRNLEPPLLKLTNSSPTCFAPDMDGTKAKLAFGRWAFPKLKRELARDDIFVVMQALNSIHDLVYNPERAFEAIRLGIVDRLTNMMLHERDFIREKICMILYTIGGLEAGRRVIVRRYKILHNLALLLEDDVDAVRQKAQLVLEIISLSPVGANSLNCADYIILILRLIGGFPKTEHVDVLTLHLATLKMLLLQLNDKILALKHNAMDILIDKIDHPNENVRMNALDCIAILCQDSNGRTEGADKNLGELLCKKLSDSSRDVRVKAVGALAFATIQSDTRSQLCKSSTVDIVMGVLEDFHNSEGQFLAAKLLSNLSEDPKGKSLVRKMKSRIKAIFTNNDDEIDRHKKLLLNLLKK